MAIQLYCVVIIITTFTTFVRNLYKFMLLLCIVSILKNHMHDTYSTIIILSICLFCICHRIKCWVYRYRVGMSTSLALQF